MSSKPNNNILLLYGSGPNVGAAILKKFASNGWKTVAVVRTLKEEYKNSADLVLQADFSSVESIRKVYEDVEAKLGTPHCVVYNAYSLSSPSTSENPFSADPSSFAADITVNAIGLYAAASAAATGFLKLGPQDPKVFIDTGNATPSMLIPEIPGLGAGKTAGAYLMESGARTLGHYGGEDGNRDKATDSQWYFADERTEAGMPVMQAINAEAHAEMYWELANAGKQRPWNCTFVKGKGYVKFPDVNDRKYASLPELLAAAAS